MAVALEQLLTRRCTRSMMMLVALMSAATPARTQGPLAPELEAVQGFVKAWKLSYRIRVPKGALTDKNDFGHTYRLRINSTFDCSVTITKVLPSRREPRGRGPRRFSAGPAPDHRGQQGHGRLSRPEEAQGPGRADGRCVGLQERQGNAGLRPVLGPGEVVRRPHRDLQLAERGVVPDGVQARSQCVPPGRRYPVCRVPIGRKVGPERKRRKWQDGPDNLNGS